MAEDVSLRITNELTRLSELLGMSACIIQRRMAEYGLSSNNYSDISEEELDRMVTEITEQFLRVGYRQILAILKSVSIKHGLRTTDYGLRTGYKTRTQV